MTREVRGLSQDAPGFSSWLVRTWVSVYTLGLAEDIRRERRAEIDADIWEQTVAGDSGRHGAALLLRCLRGVLDDLLWRATEARSEGVPGWRNQIMATFMARSRSSKLTTMVMVMLVAGAAIFTLFYNSWYNDPARGDTTFADALWPWAFFWIAFAGLGLASLVGGLFVAGRSRWTGTAIALGGVWLLALTFYWLAYVPLVLAAVVTGVALWLGWRSRAQTRRTR